MANGKIADKEISILKDIGSWLKLNGEAVYDSKVWRTSAEGPTEEAEGKFSEGNASAYTNEDFRFTAGHGCIYAIALNYDGSKDICIKSLACGRDANSVSFQGIITDVEILGYNGKAEWSHETDGLRIKATGYTTGFPVVIKVHTC